MTPHHCSWVLTGSQLTGSSPGFELLWAFLGPGEAQILSGGRMLSLPSPRLHDSGTYTCVASSAVGEDRHEATLEVQCKYPHTSVGGPALGWGPREGGLGKGVAS